MCRSSFKVKFKKKDVKNIYKKVESNWGVQLSGGVLA
jgi:hypothetical protein